MASDRSGVNGLMKNANPHFIFVHRVFHCLALAVFAGLQEKSRHEYGIYNSYRCVYICSIITKPPTNFEKPDVLDQATVKFVVLYDIRWMSMGNAVLESCYTELWASYDAH